MALAAVRSPRPEVFPMSPRENVMRLIAQLPDDKMDELERLVIAMLPAGSESEPSRGPRLSFEEALSYTNKTFENTLRKLGQ